MRLLTRILAASFCAIVVSSCSDDDVTVANEFDPYGWELQKDDIDAILYDVHFVDEQYGWVSTLFPDTLYATEDGGETWMARAFTPNMNEVLAGGLSHLGQFHFISRTTGFAANDIGTCFRTDNGGYTWTNISGDRRWSRIHFVSDAVGFAIDLWDARWYKTLDGGMNWQEQLLNDDISASHNFMDIRFTDQQRGILTGDAAIATNDDNSKGSAVFITTDGGVSWQTQLFPDMERAGHVTILGDEIWIASRQDYILYSPDFGKTWEERDYEVDRDITYLEFVDRLNGWMILQSPQQSDIGIGVSFPSIFRTTDGGISWQAQNAQHRRGTGGPDIYDLEFTDAQHGWAVGPRGIYRTMTGGELE